MAKSNEEIAQIIIDIISDINPDADCSAIDPDVSLREQMDLDSMDFLDIVMELRKQYDINIPEADYPQLATLNSCIAYLSPKM